MLVDAEERHRNYPDSFWIPPPEERRSLRVGDMAKLDFESRERMWVRVIEVAAQVGNIYVGVLTNTPVVVKARRGDRIEFGPRHVVDILRLGGSCPSSTP